jgi:hypothetical protein
MHQAEKLLTKEQRFLMAIHLKELTVKNQNWSCCEGEDWSLTCFATAAQRAEAFLHILNLWKNDA